MRDFYNGIRMVAHKVLINSLITRARRVRWYIHKDLALEQ